MLGIRSTKKIEAKKAKELSLRDIFSIIQACEQSKVHSFELGSLKILFAPPEKEKSDESSSINPSENQGKDSQPKNDSLHDEIANLQLQGENPLEWEEKILGLTE
jgi:hypothetical protein